MTTGQKYRTEYEHLCFLEHGLHLTKYFETVAESPINANKKVKNSSIFIIFWIIFRNSEKIDCRSYFEVE